MVTAISASVRPSATWAARQPSRLAASSCRTWERSAEMFRLARLDRAVQGSCSRQTSSNVHAEQIQLVGRAGHFKSVDRRGQSIGDAQGGVVMPRVIGSACSMLGRPTNMQAAAHKRSSSKVLRRLLEFATRLFATTICNAGSPSRQKYAVCPRLKRVLVAAMANARQGLAPSVEWSAP